MFRKIFLFITILLGIFSTVLLWNAFIVNKGADPAGRVFGPFGLFLGMLYVWWMWNDA